jgi:hypothetical protein
MNVLATSVPFAEQPSTYRSFFDSVGGGGYPVSHAEGWSHATIARWAEWLKSSAITEDGVSKGCNRLTGEQCLNAPGHRERC